ncbi:hypothetical protein GCM10027056_05240 [Glaciibacter psychrotolerans]
MLTRTEPAIHNPNVDGLTLISLTPRRSRVKVPRPSRVQYAAIAFVALLALLGLGQFSSAQAVSSSDVPRGPAHSSSVLWLHAPRATGPGVTSGGVPSGVPSSVDTSSRDAVSLARTVSAESSEPMPDIPGSDVQPIWLLPLGIGAVTLGVVFLVALRRQNRDDRD